MRTKDVSLIKKYPITAYFVLTFLISWGAILLVIAGFGGLPTTKEQFNAQLPTAIPAMLGGPSIAGILMTYIANGKNGIRELFSRLAKWKVHFKWYIFAILAAPLVLIVTLLALSLISSEYLPGFLISGNVLPVVISGIGAGIAVGIFEELGWTGFAVSILRKKYSILITGLIVGGAWGAWHILSNDIWACQVYTGNIPLPLFVIADGLLFIIGQLPAYRILTVWVYGKTGSLPVTMLMHAGLTASTMIFQPLNIEGTSLLVYTTASAVAMWLAVLVVYFRHLCKRMPADRTGRKICG